MKYTNYLLNTNFVDVDSLVSKNKYLEEPSKILPITISLVGIVCIGSLLPFTIIVDTFNKLRP